MVVVNCDEEGCKYKTQDVGEAAAAAFITHHLTSVHQPLKQEEIPLMKMPQPAGPPSYDEAIGPHPAQHITRPPIPSVHPYQDTTRPPMPAVHPYQDTIGMSMSAINATVQGTTVPCSDDLPESMNKEGLLTVCSGCHQQVVTSVSREFNDSAWYWSCYSLCYGLVFCWFLFCMDHFRTWKHTCPSCGKILKEFSPKVSEMARTVLGIVIIMNAIIFVIFMYNYLFPFGI